MRSKVQDSNEYNYNDKNICYLFDSGYYGNHVKNAFNAISLPSGAITIYKYNLESETGKTLIETYKGRTNNFRENNCALLTIIDRHKKDEKGNTTFDYWPFRYGEILNMIQEGDGYVYVYVKLLHYVKLADRKQTTNWIKCLTANKVYPPTIGKDDSEMYCFPFFQNTLNENTGADSYFTLSKNLRKDAAIWGSLVSEFSKIPFFKSVLPTDEDYEKNHLFFYRFYIIDAAHSAKKIDPIIDLFNIDNGLSTDITQVSEGVDCRYVFDIDKKYAIILQCYFPDTKKDGAERAKVRIRIKLGDYIVSEQIYSDNLSTQRIVFTINRRQFQDYSAGSLTIEVLPSDDSARSKEFLICAPSTELKFEIKKTFLRRNIEPLVIAGFGAVLLTLVEAIRGLSANQLLFSYIASNWGYLLCSLAINIAVMVPFVWLTKRDMLK